MSIRLVFDRSDLEKVLDPKKRTPEEEAARLATLREARALRLVIKPAPTSAGPQG